MPFRIAAFAHNLALALYSGYTAVNIIPLTVSHLRHHGVLSLYCSNALWNAGLSYWSFLFYLSKYVELLDTHLLLVKQKKPSYLHLYHHALTIYCAYWLQLSHTSVSFLFVSLNASVHTIMYSYYALTLLSIRFPLKHLITTLQMLQFVVGIVLALPMFLLQNAQCALLTQKLALSAIILHVLYLLYLFANFYNATYNTNNNKPKKIKSL